MSAESIEFHPEAAQETQGATEWYLRRSVRAAERFVAELERAIGVIAKAPDRWPLFMEGTRRYPLPRFPFWVIYRVSGETLQILAVAHARRRPGYWRSRAGENPE